MTAPMDWSQFQSDQQGLEAPSLPMAPVAPTAPAPAPVAPSGPSFWDRLSGGLLPTGGSPLAALLNPQQLHALRSQALLGLGANLLARSGPRPVGTSSPLSDIGQALGATQQGWPGMLTGAAQQAAALNQFVIQAKQRQAVQDFMQSHPLSPDAGPSEIRAWVAQAIPAFLASGNEAGIGQLGTLLQGLQGGKPELKTIRGPGGRPVMAQVFPDGTQRILKDDQGKPVEPTPDAAAIEAHGATVDNNLQSQWRGDKQVQNALGRMDTINSAVSLAPEAIKGNATAQFGLLDNMIRTYNPNAVVRGNTVAQYLDLLPLSQKATGEIQRLAAGKGGLSATTIQEMMTALQKIQGTTYQNLQRSYDRYAALAQRHQRDPSILFELPQPADFTGLTSQPVPKAPHPGAVSAEADSLLRKRP